MTSVTRPAMASEIQRRLQTGCDLAFLRNLFAESRDDLLLLPSDTRELLLDTQFRARRRAMLREHPDARHEVIVDAFGPVGHVAVADTPDAVHLVELSVRSEARGRGIGTRVLAEICAGAEATDRRVWLCRPVADPVAVRVLARHGIRPAPV